MNGKYKKRGGARSPKKQRNLMIMVVAIGVVLVLLGIEMAKGGEGPGSDRSTIELGGLPGLKVDQELIDFGDVKLNTNLTFEFQVTNVGDRPLEFSRTPYVEVKEGC